MAATCEQCGKPATQHGVLVVDGRKVHHELCDGHGREVFYGQERPESMRSRIHKCDEHARAAGLPVGLQDQPPPAGTA